jgi:signal transduction histidine kinase
LTGLALVFYGWRVTALKRARAAQQNFSQQLIESQERERQRIAGELHDSLGQDLLVIKNRSLLGAQDAQSNTRALEQFEAISQMASESLREVREISRNLRPYQLDQLGLTKAAQAIIASVSQASAMTIAADLDRLDGLVPAEQEIHLYRILQELLNNIVKHSGAAEARVSLKHRGDRISLVVADDGRGFSGAAAGQEPATKRGLGLTDIAERVRILGGEAHCDSSPGRGTRWAIEIPVRSSIRKDS